MNSVKLFSTQLMSTYVSGHRFQIKFFLEKWIWPFWIHNLNMNGKQNEKIKENKRINNLFFSDYNEIDVFIVE